MPGLELGTFWRLSLVPRIAPTPVPDLDTWECSRDYPLIGGSALAHNSEARRNTAASQPIGTSTGGRVDADSLPGSTPCVKRESKWWYFTATVGQ